MVVSSLNYNSSVIENFIFYLQDCLCISMKYNLVWAHYDLLNILQRRILYYFKYLVR